MRDFGDVRNKGFVHIDGGAHPVRFLNIGAEGFRMAKAMIFDLSCHRFPKVEGIPSPRLEKAQIWGLVLRAVAGTIHARAIGDEDVIIRAQINCLFLPRNDDFNALGPFLSVRAFFHDDIGHFRMGDEAHAALL